MADPAPKIEVARTMPTDLLTSGRWRTWSEPDKVKLRNVLRRAKFRRTYEYDPVAFVHDCFKWDDLPDSGPAPYQSDVLAKLVEEHRVALRGPHGLGKSSCLAWAILWFALTRDGDNWKVPTTASARAQLRLYLWPEVHVWVRRLRWEAIGRDPFIEGRDLLDEALKLDTGEAYALASNDPAKMEGGHADRMLIIYDEAKKIPAGTFEAFQGAVSNAGPETGREALELMGSTPGDPHGHFYQVNQRRVPGYKLIIVTKEMAIAAGRMSPSWVERMKTVWGEHSATYIRRVEGNFAAGDEKSVLPQAWVEAAVERWTEAAVPAVGDADLLEGRVFDGLMLPEELVGPLSVASMDVADSGDDRTTIALRHGPAIIRLQEFPYDPDAHLMAATGALVAILRGAEAGFATVDSVGVGAGVLARLQELRRTGEIREDPVGFIAQGKSDLMDETGSYGFRDLRAEAWWGFRQRLHPTKGDGIMLPPHDELQAELTVSGWRALSEGRIRIEEKDEVKKADRLGRSPDLADAVVMAFWARPAVAYSQTGRGRRIPGM